MTEAEDRLWGEKPGRTCPFCGKDKSNGICGHCGTMWEVFSTAEWGTRICETREPFKLNQFRGPWVKAPYGCLVVRGGTEQ